ncbi:MAG: TonB family protein [Acidobacteriota bacterium]|nr:TonB family protein [Acidobacteriota bacterium]
MSASALLFFSDQRASAWLSDALKKLGLQVELCSEIFSCLEKLTSRRYDLIAVDCSQGAEALFLLKTARDLKQNQDAFSIILANQRDWSAAQRAGASLILENPIVPEDAMHTLLGCPEFLVRMKNWALSIDQQKGPELKAAELRSSAIPQSPAQAPIFAEETLPVEPLAAMPDKNSPLAHREIKSPSASRMFNSEEDQLFLDSAANKFVAPRKKFGFFHMGPVNASFFTRGAALVFAFLCFGYSVSQPLVASAIFRVATQTCAHTLARAETFLLKPSSTTPDTETSSSFNGSNRWPSPRISVRSAANHISSKASQDPANGTADKYPQPAPTTLSTSPRPIEIPQSLQTPLRQAPTAGPIIARPGSLLERGLGIITLAPEVSQKMLLARTMPVYPAQARQRGLEGSVEVQALIAVDGSIEALKLIRGSLILGAAACQAIKQWRYRPYVLNGQAVEAQTYVTIDFKLPEEVTRADIRNSPLPTLGETELSQHLPSSIRKVE